MSHFNLIEIREIIKYYIKTFISNIIVIIIVY